MDIISQILRFFPGASRLLHSLLFLIKHIFSKFFQAVHFTAYVLVLQPCQKAISLYLWGPVSIIIRTVTQLLLLPFNIPLGFFYDTSVNEIVTHINLHLAIVTLQIFVQYTITLMVIGVSIGIFWGVFLGTLHKVTRIPDKYIDIPWDLTNWLTEYTFSRQKLKMKTDSNESLRTEDESTISPLKRRMISGHRTPPSSRTSASGIASKLPHDFFQPKGSNNRTGRQYDPSNVSPMSITNDEIVDSVSMSSNIWDPFDEAPNTLRTDGATTISSHPRSYSTGNSEINNFNIRKMKTRV